jgi:hypothetical protein
MVARFSMPKTLLPSQSAAILGFGCMKRAARVTKSRASTSGVMNSSSTGVTQAPTRLQSMVGFK